MKPIVFQMNSNMLNILFLFCLLIKIILGFRLIETLQSFIVGQVSPTVCFSDQDY